MCKHYGYDIEEMMQIIIFFYIFIRICQSCYNSDIRVNLLFQSESAKPLTGQSHMQLSHICYVARRETMFVGRVVGVQTEWDKPVFPN